MRGVQPAPLRGGCVFGTSVLAGMFILIRISATRSVEETTLACAASLHVGVAVVAGTLYLVRGWSAVQVWELNLERVAHCMLVCLGMHRRR